MADLRLRTALRTAGNSAALIEGTVAAPGLVFEFEEVPIISHAFRRMVRELAYDVCEMALTTYICAKAHGKPFTALPVFPVRAFHHGAVVHTTKAGLTTPKDLEGRRVGVNRGYTVTTGVWARGILQDEHDVDLSRVTWVLSGDEHVTEFRPPPNVVPMEAGKDLGDMLVAGELAAAIGITVDHPDVEPLIADADEAGYAALRDRGLYPINHLVVVRDELLAEHPTLAAELFALFTEAKAAYLARLSEGIAEPDSVDVMHARVMAITGDPLPYGIDANRAVIDRLMAHAVTQGIIDRPIPMGELFAAGTHSLTG